MSDSDSRENDVSGRRRRTAPVLDSETDSENDPLSTSPFEGDLTEELAKAPRARRLPGLTTYLGAGVVLAIGFVIGVQTDRHTGQQASNTAQGAPGMPGGGMPGGGMPGGMAGGGMRGGGMPGQAGGGQGQGGGGHPGGAGATTGTVQKIDGKTIYVQTANGVVQVKTTGTTKIQMLRNGSAKDLKSGTSVVVQGSQGKDGTVTATSVSQGASSGG
jgi:hypothetical protein